MSSVYKITVGPIKTNTYLFECEKSVFCVVDPAGKAEKIVSFANSQNGEVKHILITHGHFDHVGAASELKKMTNAKIYMNGNDIKILKKCFVSGRVKEFECDVLFNSDTVITLQNREVKVLSTPGHTAGGVCYVLEDEKIIFSGDTLFRLEIGRCDMESGNFEDMKKSLKKLIMLDGDYKVYPGHDLETTLNLERKFNPYILEL